MSNSFFVSIVVPTYNEEKNITPLLKRLVGIVSPYDYEIVMIDDGSKDNTQKEIKQHAEKNKRVKLLSFSRNFGHQIALTCGYQYAKGDCVITLDSDLQDPPEIIPQMIEKWRKGATIVYAKREKRDVDTLFKKLSARFFYKLINFLSDIPIPQDVGDFRLLDRTVVSYLNGLPEQSRFLRGLVAWSGQPAEYVYFQREKRNAGKTNYTFPKMLNFALEGITSFSTKPLRLAVIMGFGAAALGFLGTIYAILGRIFLSEYWVPGWAALFTGIMFIGGVQLITIGIIGEYIGKIYQEVQRRPQYLIKEKVNL